MVCEEFHCLPAQAIEAIENDVGGLLFRIIELRHYSKAKQAYDEDITNGVEMGKRRKGGMIEVVRDFMFDIAKEQMQKRKERGTD